MDDTIISTGKIREEDTWSSSQGRKAEYQRSVGDAVKYLKWS